MLRATPRGTYGLGIPVRCFRLNFVGFFSVIFGEVTVGASRGTPVEMTQGTYGEIFKGSPGEVSGRIPRVISKIIPGEILERVFCGRSPGVFEKVPVKFLGSFPR